MPPQASTLIRLVMETLGVNGATALARELGMTDYGAPRKIGDWIEGRFAPNYEATMLMLERAGFLNLDANAPRQPAAGRSPLSPRQQYLLQAAQDGHPQNALAVIFSTPQDQIQTELRTARDELATWQETRGKEQTPGEQETEPAEKPVLEIPSTEKLAQAVSDLIQTRELHEETGELTLESLEHRIKAHHELALATKADIEALQARLQAQFERDREQTKNTPGKEAE